MIVVNLFAGPGVGKSTLAASIFAELKKRGENVELITEYAKQLTWESRIDALDDQVYVFAKQSRALRRVRGKVDIAVTDAPLLQSCAYIGQNLPVEFSTVVNKIFDNSSLNVNYFLKRKTGYQNSGRNQELSDAIELDDKILELLHRYGHAYEAINPLEEGIEKQIADNIVRLNKL